MRAINTVGDARRRKLSGTDPHEKAPKTYLWPRSFLEQIRDRFQDIVMAAKRGGFPPPSEDAFVKAVLTAGFMKMDAEMAAAKAAREQSRIIAPSNAGNVVPGGQGIVVVGR